MPGSSSTATTCWRCGTRERAAAGPGRRGADAARVQDVPHAGPRGGVGERPCLRRTSPPGRDPIERFEARLDEAGLLPRPSAPALREELRFDVETLVSEALAAPAPATTEDHELGRVYAAPALLRRADAGSAPPAPTTCATLDAVRDALRVALAADDRVVLLGQDIAGYGGVFKATEGLADEFGTERVRNTPIIESEPSAPPSARARRVPAGRGDAVRRLRELRVQPVGQQRGHDALPLERRRAPRRAPARGRGSCAGPFHSQNVEAWFCHVPGLKVVAPATADDAKGLLLAALDDGNPVLVLEHKRLYRSVRGPVPGGHHVVPDRRRPHCPARHRRHARDLRRRRRVGGRRVDTLAARAPARWR